MDTFSINSKQSVEQILKQWPQTATVFIQAKTACVGCRLSRFCNLDDVASYYKLVPATLRQAVQECVQNSQILYKGAKHEIVP